MALSNTEKVRRYRERQKQKKLEILKLPTPRSELYKQPFFEYFPESEQLGSAYVQSLELAGIQPLLFEDDSGPETVTLDDIREEDELVHGSVFGVSEGSSLGKAEVLVGCLLDAAADLAGCINDYKKKEIKARIAELEAADLSTPEAKREAFSKMSELTDVLAELEKEVRWPIPVWRPELKGRL